jgi:hypothetical protein
VCINDARRVFATRSIRGILIKKFEFSVGDRGFLERFFSRTVFNRRITGELLIQHKDLIPNAARSDFEANATRQAFLQEAIPSFIDELSRWANSIQSEEKARDMLNGTTKSLSGIVQRLPALQRDREALIVLNVQLAEIERQLGPHVRALEDIDAKGLRNVQAMLAESKATVREALLEKQRGRVALEQRAARAAQQRVASAAVKDRSRRGDSASSLVELFESFDLVANAEVGKVVRYLDEEVLRDVLDEEAYRVTLARAQEILEGVD